MYSGSNGKVWKCSCFIERRNVWDKQNQSDDHVTNCRSSRWGSGDALGTHPSFLSERWSRELLMFSICSDTATSRVLIDHTGILAHRLLQVDPRNDFLAQSLMCMELAQRDSHSWLKVDQHIIYISPHPNTPSTTSNSRP